MCMQLQELLNSDSSLPIVDVRPEAEFKTAHMPGVSPRLWSVHHALALLPACAVHRPLHGLQIVGKL